MGNENADKLILIVEDEDALAEVLADTLEIEGFKVKVCSNGEEGLKYALENHPSLILLDMLMPKMNGMTMLVELRKKQTAPISPVIFFTNLNQLDKIAHAVEEGAEGYMIKAETSLEEIVKKVIDFFQKKATEKK